MKRNTILEDFERQCRLYLSSDESLSEIAIEEAIKLISKLPIYSKLTDHEVLNTIRKIQQNLGVKMQSASIIKDISTHFEEWLNLERIEKINLQYSTDYNKYLIERKGYSNEVVYKIEEDTQKILSQSGDPKLNKDWDRRGMVVGSVQSGKTSNYLYLLAQAIDHGYKVIIVIAGLSENLRQQTQERINYGLIGQQKNINGSIVPKKIGVGIYRDNNFKTPYTFTDQSIDFDLNTARSQAVKFDMHLERPCIFVIKKNKDILNNASDRDHSLEYMVAAALLFGDVTSDSYEDTFEGYKDIEYLRKKITVKENPEFTETYYKFEKREIANSIYLEYEDGSKSEKITVRYPIGHPKRRQEAIPLIREKFIKNTSRHLDRDQAIHLWTAIYDLETDAEFSQLTNLLLNE